MTATEPSWHLTNKPVLARGFHCHTMRPNALVQIWRTERCIFMSNHDWWDQQGLGHFYSDILN